MKTTSNNPLDPNIPEELSISPPEVQTGRLLGSYSSKVPLRAFRSRHSNGGSDPPLPSPPPVSAPDLAIQFLPCLEKVPTPPGYDLRAAVTNSLREAFGADADIRYLCMEDIATIGIWLRPFVSESDADARDRGMKRVKLLRPGENFAFFENASLIRRSATEVWNNLPKRLNGDGDPDANGPLHLTGFSIRFKSPDRIQTIVEGFDERPWPDVDFKLTITDKLSVSGGEVQCESDKDLDVDTSWLNFLTGLFLFSLPPLGIVFFIERIIISTVDAPEGQSGVGRSAAQLVPDEILIPGGLKISAYFNRITVSSSGIYAGGLAEPTQRFPTVNIKGRTKLSVESDRLNTTSYYTVVHDDLLGPLTINWTADGTVLAPGAISTSIRFDTRGSSSGEVLTKRITVNVSDRDNLNATAENIVSIHLTDPEWEGPPICRKKPWLPHCEPK